MRAGHRGLFQRSRLRGKNLGIDLGLGKIVLDILQRVITNHDVAAANGRRTQGSAVIERLTATITTGGSL